MSEQKQRVYVKGSIVKARQTSFGEVLNVSLRVSELVELNKEFANEKGYLNLQILPRKEIGQYGDSHSMIVDQWTKPDASPAPAKKSAVSKPAPKKATVPAEEESEPPF